jgi:hypothetical protein
MFGITKKLIHYITFEQPVTGFPMCDFERLKYEVRPCDVLLIEGRSRVSEVIKNITQSPWSHACLYIGRIHDIDDIELRKKIEAHYNYDPDVQLVIEGFLGKGTIISPLNIYHRDHVRICRPRGLSRQDAQQVLSSALNRLGQEYDVKQIFDLFRFLIPWSILPRTWRSRLFQSHAGTSTKTVCSTMIADAFSSINFPILPLIKQHEETGIELIERNPMLFTPRDFDYSPYFEIIKYPFIGIAEHGLYKNLPWNPEGLVSNDSQGVVNQAVLMQNQLAENQKLAKSSKSKNKTSGVSVAADSSFTVAVDTSAIYEREQNPQRVNLINQEEIKQTKKSKLFGLTKKDKKNNNNNNSNNNSDNNSGDSTPPSGSGDTGPSSGSNINIHGSNFSAQHSDKLKDSFFSPITFVSPIFFNHVLPKSDLVKNLLRWYK